MNLYEAIGANVFFLYNEIKKVIKRKLFDQSMRKIFLK